MYKFISLIATTALIACNRSADNSEKPFFDTTCTTDTVVFRSSNIMNPYAKIVTNNCTATTLLWSHANTTNHRRIEVSDHIKNSVRINEKITRTFFKDSTYVWLLFNDCLTGRGYALKLPYDKKADLFCYSSALNNFDKKFTVAPGLICYTNYRYVYVEDEATGKTAKLEFSATPLDIDFNKIHNTFDSVHITRTRIFVQLKNKDPLEATINL